MRSSLMLMAIFVGWTSNSLLFMGWSPILTIVWGETVYSLLYLYNHHSMGLNPYTVLDSLPYMQDTCTIILLFMTYPWNTNSSFAFAHFAGPAATGKTATVKDLAKALGLLCVVTNCSDAMDCKALGKILCALCHCGAWGCFDEFHRLDASVLSVLSTQLQAIRSALLHRLKRFNVRF